MPGIFFFLGCGLLAPSSISWQLKAYEVHTATLTNAFQINVFFLLLSVLFLLLLPKHSPLRKSYAGGTNASKSSQISALSRRLWLTSRFYSGTNIVVPMSLRSYPCPFAIPPHGNASSSYYPDAGIQCCNGWSVHAPLSCRCSNCCLTQTSRRVRARIQGQLISYSACSTLGH